MTEQVTDPAVRDVMTPQPHAVAPDTGFKAIAELLAAHQISAVAVVDSGGRPVGVVSEADLLHKRDQPKHRLHRHGLARHRAGDRLRRARSRCAKELMTTPVVTVEAGAPVSHAAGELERHHVHRLFVVENGTLVGVLSRRDVIGACTRPDDEIRRDVANDVFDRMMWVDLREVGIGVERGVVTLLGQLPRRSDIALAGRLTRDVPGVVEVRNRLGYVWDDHPDGRRTGVRA
ncbi:CBS domain-containing protein [Saccharomonospora sp. NPDC046836]|uniref:CBS domain-containing protein n=1 Tax=Saccharomonospora sp. NPDC046836 TaxID=3156921 RepID=UPI0033C0F133